MHTSELTRYLTFTRCIVYMLILCNCCVCFPHTGSWFTYCIFCDSVFSAQVLITLQEKEVEYEPVIVSIHTGEQNEAWYMRITSAGVVPVLQDGEKIIKESENIVDYIDREFPTGNILTNEEIAFMILDTKNPSQSLKGGQGCLMECSLLESQGCRLSFDSPFLSPLLFFCLVLLHVLSSCFLEFFVVVAFFVLLF